MRISDWSSDVCSSDLHAPAQHDARHSGLSSPCHRKGSKVTVTSRTTESWLPHSSHVPHATALRSACRRSEERRVGKECVSTCRSRRSQYHSKKKDMINQ